MVVNDCGCLTWALFPMILHSSGRCIHNTSWSTHSSLWKTQSSHAEVVLVVLHQEYSALNLNRDQGHRRYHATVYSFCCFCFSSKWIFSTHDYRQFFKCVVMSLYVSNHVPSTGQNEHAIRCVDVTEVSLQLATVKLTRMFRRTRIIPTFIIQRLLAPVLLELTNRYLWQTSY